MISAIVTIIIIIIIIPLFVHQCHEQEIPEVIPIEGIPFLNQSKSNQLNLTQHKSNQINQMLVYMHVSYEASPGLQKVSVDPQMNRERM